MGIVHVERRPWQSWTRHAKEDFFSVSVCSDERATSRGKDLLFTSPSAVGIPPTTDADVIADKLNVHGPVVVFATYQSSEVLEQIDGEDRGDRTPALRKAVDELLKFFKEGGNVDQVLPPESEVGEADKEALGHLAELRDETEEIRLLGDQIRLLGSGEVGEEEEDEEDEED